MKSFIFSMTVFVMSMPIWAGVGSPTPVRVTQPDGTTFMVQIMGDEHRHWIETTDGYTVRKHEQTQQWEYMLRSKRGDLVSSGVAVGEKKPVGIRKHSKPAMARLIENPALDMRMGKAAGEWQPSLISGTRRLLFIAVNFTDRSLTTTTAEWDDTIYNSTPGVKSVVNFYDDNSRGLLQPVPAPHSQSSLGVIEVSINKKHPNTGNSNQGVSRKYSIETSWINAALSAAAAHVDFNALDTNSDGELALDEAVVYFIVAGWDASGSAKEPSVWAHKWSAWSVGDVAVSGVNVNRWAINGELYDDDTRHPMGVITHELGHLMCYLPDLYDTANGNSAMGAYSLMASGSWGYAYTDARAGDTPMNMDAWCRYVIGWSNPRVLSGGTTTSFGPALDTADAAVLLRDQGANANEYWLVENRVPQGWDEALAPQLEVGQADVNDGGNIVSAEPMTFSPSGVVTGTAVDCGRGLVAGDFPAGVNGEIALIERGDDTYNAKVVNAVAAGANAVIIYNNVAGALFGTLGGAGNYVPSVGIQQADGPGLAGKTVTVTITSSTFVGGLLVQHIDVSVGTQAGNNINSSNNAHQGVTVEEADSSQGSLLDGANSVNGHLNHLYWAGNNDAFTPSTTPNSDYYSGGASGLGITAVSAAGTNMTATIFGGGTGNNAPTAGFTYAATDLNVNFTDASSDSDGSIVSWSWTFGDGNSSSAQNPSHSYASAGTYSVSLTVTDDGGLTGSTNQSVTVTSGGGNVAPTASFTYADSGLNVDFTDNSSDSDGSIVSWSWTFGDGNSSSAQNPSHTYAASGTYSVGLTVTDDGGLTDSTTQSVTVSSGGGTTTDTFSGSIRGQKTKNHTISVSGGIIDLSLTWNNSADLDLFLLDSGGSQVASATTSGQPETISFDTGGASGSYTIRIISNAARSNNAGYTVTATYEP